MKINITAKSIELSQAIREYIEKKLNSVEKKLIDPNNTGAFCDVEVGKTTDHHKQGDVFRAEFNLNVDGVYLRTESEKDNLYAAIDEAKDELFSSLRSKKKKKMHLGRRGALKIKNFIKGLKW